MYTSQVFCRLNKYKEQSNTRLLYIHEVCGYVQYNACIHVYILYTQHAGLSYVLQLQPIF